MKAFDAGFAAHIGSGATTLATCWKLTRTDGAVLGFTDHDAALSFDGTDYQPAHGLDGAERPARLGAAVDTSEVAGVLHSDAIAEADILMGRYDGAVVEIYRVNWRNVDERTRLGRWTIGEITREDGAFRAELRSRLAALNVPKGRIYARLCDAELGDARCGMDLSGAAWRAEAVVTAIGDRYRIEVEGISGFAAGWFDLGIAAWSSGVRFGLKDRVLATERPGTEDVLSFAVPVGEWAAIGDTLVLTAGCDRTFATCRARFGNGVNFRGFPHIPGSDYVLRYPRSGTKRDGAPVVP
jgi:uncharacterized phage protein (TIGR02218 family)